MNDEENIPPARPEPEPRAPRFHWLLFFAFLLGPAVLTCLAVLIDHSSNSAAVGMSMFGGALGGIGCGVLLGRRFGRSDGVKILLGVIFAAVCGVASITIATLGCLASGYQLNLH